MGAYYNEYDPQKAAWLRELIKAGLIAPGEVDERDVRDVAPSELVGYTQCHFFAGIGIWSHALRNAGWPDERPVWTGSCPCQSFSSAGLRKGFDDERHLWPAWFWLVQQLRPGCIFGEQVASKDALAWLDLVSADLEGANYAIGALDLCAAGAGSPQIRQRLFYVAERLAYDQVRGLGQGCADVGGLRVGDRPEGFSARPLPSCPNGGMADEQEQRFREAGNCCGRSQERSSDGGELVGVADPQTPIRRRSGGKAKQGWRTTEVGRPSADGGLDGADDERQQTGCGGEPRRTGRADDGIPACGLGGAESLGRLGRSDDRDGRGRERSSGQTGPVNGFWSGADWILRRRSNGSGAEWCPVEPFPQQMANGATQSLGRVCDSVVQAMEEAIMEYAHKRKADPRKTLHDLWEEVTAEALRWWSIGGLPMLHEAPVLLAFLCQLQKQGWALAEGISCPSEEAQKDNVRMLRGNDPASCSPHRRGLDKQLSTQHSNTLRVLSPVLARITQAAWAEAYDTHASDVFPLVLSSSARVVRLRGYGDGIVSPLATEFIKAYLGEGVLT